MKALLAIAVSVLVAAGCGGSGGDQTTARPAAPTQPASGARPTQLPPGALPPPGREEPSGAAAGEASPEAPASGPQASGELPEGVRATVSATVGDYIAALDHREAARVCGLMTPGSLDPEDLPESRGGCTGSLRASIGSPPHGGGPAWRRSSLVATKVERLSDDRARVSATVTHHFSDRKYVSVEDDVIYLERAGGRWLLAQPSATLYRAVGYGEPPLRAFSPPVGW